MSTRSHVESALRDCLGYSRLRPLAARARLRRLYFQLRADGMKARAARAVARRARKAIAGLRREPKGLGTAVDVILA